MGNCCRIYVDADIVKVKESISEHPAVKRFGNNPIVMASNSIFGAATHPNISDKTVEINLINSIHQVAEDLKQDNIKLIVCQDLDGYGKDVWFTL